MIGITSEFNYRTTFLAQAQFKNVLDAIQWAKYILKYFNWKLVTAEPEINISLECLQLRAETHNYVTKANHRFPPTLFSSRETF